MHEHERSLMPEHERPYRKRDYAKELIEKSILNGFVAVYQDEIVGFFHNNLLKGKYNGKL